MVVQRLRWRDYSTQSGRRPVAEFIRTLDDQAAAAVVAAMKKVDPRITTVERYAIAMGEELAHRRAKRPDAGTRAR